MLTLLTDVPLEEINSFDVSQNPMELKKRIAHTLVASLHSEKEAKEAEENFSNTFQKGQIPEVIPEVSNTEGKSLMEVLVENKNLSSKSEFRRLVKEGAVTDLETGEKVEDPDLVPKGGQGFKIGKKTFIRISN
jgi:tyrosyl-tRNA synthetase